MAELYIGTSGYDYPEWKGKFYPETVKHSDFLSYYATQFNALELNGTYYKMPTQDQMQNMINRTDGKVKFTIKAFGDLTHKKDKTLTSEFKKALEPLLNNNLLLSVLLQFPQSFHYEKEERLYLDSLIKEFSGTPLVVELRNTQWQVKQVYDALRERRVAWCITDNPELKDLPKLEYPVTSDIAYMRFHGRNAQMWYSGNNVTRYDYFYSDAEIESFIEPIKYILQHTKIIQLFFNNHAKSQATVNARKLELLLNRGV
jgi:uncharacterized protein YecE (DUF72 family)